MPKTAMIVGNSDGIGLALTRALLDREWDVVGISRSDSTIKHPRYEHLLSPVQHVEFAKTLSSVIERKEAIDLCVYCAGVGELLDVTNMDIEVEIFEINLIGMVKTASAVIPRMVERGSGHVIGLSSVADEMLSPEAPSYHASKAGLSSYLEGLALALRPRGVHVTNVRFGFVDTKMAKGDVRPFIMPVEKAVGHLLSCIDKKPIRFTAPKIVAPLVSFSRWMQRMKTR